MIRDIFNNKYVRYGGLVLAICLSLYTVFKTTGRVYTRYSSSSSATNIERFLTLYNPNLCLQDEKSKACKDLEFTIFNTLGKYVASKEYLKKQRRVDINNSLYTVIKSNPDSLLSKITAGFPKKTFSEGVIVSE